MAFNRLAFGTAGVTYVLVCLRDTLPLVAPGFAYLLFSLLVLIDVLIRRSRSATRRTVALVLDMAMISYGMRLGGQAASLFYPLYLWVVFGNGFRFGQRYLAAATVCGGSGFVMVIVFTPFWRGLPSTACGLLAALLILPAYTGVLIGKLSRATRAAEEASRAKSMFLATVSHEFRTPLNAIVGSASLLEDTTLDRRQRDLTTVLQSGTSRLLDLVNDVLDFSRLEAGRMPLVTGRFALAPTLAEVLSLFLPQARGKGLRLGVHLSANVPDLLIADRRHLREILINLVGNAVKFTDAGSVTVHVTSQSLVPEHNEIRFSVVDTGIGIEAINRDRIFESFSQADGSIIDRFGGTGLGLAICRRLVVLMGGQIDVDSTPGLGSRFWFTLTSQQAGPEGEDDGRLSITPQVVVPCILVSDDPSLRVHVAVQRVSACPVTVAKHLPEAVRLLAENPGPGVLVLQREQTSSLIEDGELLARLDPFREIACIMLSDDALPAEARSPAVWVDTLAPRFATPVELTHAIAVACALHPKPQSSTAKRLRATRGLHILVADDNAINRRVLSKILEYEDHRVVLVADGDAALDAIAQYSFDLVLMDVNMPVLNGLEAARLHRLSEIDGSHLPILALTADASEAMRLSCVEAGMDQCLTKPIQRHHLAAVIEVMFPDAAAASMVPGVTPLADHPRFRAAFPPVDLHILEELRALGGNDFVAELLASFASDASTLVKRLFDAVAAADWLAFHECLHALRSISANVGARALYEASSDCQVGTIDLTTGGVELVQRLGQELRRFGLAIRAHPGGQIPPAASVG